MEAHAIRILENLANQRKIYADLLQGIVEGIIESDEDLELVQLFIEKHKHKITNPSSISMPGKTICVKCNNFKYPAEMYCATVCQHCHDITHTISGINQTLHREGLSIYDEDGELLVPLEYIEMKLKLRNYRRELDFINLK